MASSNSSQTQNSGSEPDERKRKRMESNRESARRSRARKQKHVDDLTAQIAELKREKEQVLETINLTRQQFLSFDAENSVLRAQMGELSQRLESLNEMVNYINALPGPGRFVGENLGYVNEPWNFGGYGYLNQPIMASADVLQY